MERKIFLATEKGCYDFMFPERENEYHILLIINKDGANIEKAPNTSQSRKIIFTDTVNEMVSELTTSSEDRDIVIIENKDNTLSLFQLKQSPVIA